jgi:hypothetical protein
LKNPTSDNGRSCGQIPLVPLYQREKLQEWRKKFSSPFFKRTPVSVPLFEKEGLGEI